MSMIKSKNIIMVSLVSILLLITSCGSIEQTEGTISQNNSNDAEAVVNSSIEVNKPSNTNDFVDSGKEQNASVGSSVSAGSASPSTAQLPSNAQKKYTDEEIDKLIEDNIVNIDTLAMKEYSDSLYKLEDNFTNYNLVIANIKSCLGEMVFSTQDKIPDFEQLTPKAYKALKNIPEYYPIYSGVSLDYINFIALLQPVNDNSSIYKSTVNELRKDDREWDFLEGLKKLTESKGYYAIDLYVEDMLVSDRILKFKGIRLNYEDGMVLEAPKENITESINDPELDAYLQKYQRQVNYSDEFKNKQWNLFLFEKRDLQPKGVVLDLNTYNDGQHLELGR